MWLVLCLYCFVFTEALVHLFEDQTSPGIYILRRQRVYFIFKQQKNANARFTTLSTRFCIWNNKYLVSHPLFQHYFHVGFSLETFLDTKNFSSYFFIQIFIFIFSVYLHYGIYYCILLKVIYLKILKNQFAARNFVNKNLESWDTEGDFSLVPHEIGLRIFEEVYQSIWILLVRKKVATTRRVNQLAYATKQSANSIGYSWVLLEYQFQK